MKQPKKLSHTFLLLFPNSLTLEKSIDFLSLNCTVVTSNLKLHPNKHFFDNYSPFLSKIKLKY